MARMIKVLTEFGSTCRSGKVHLSEGRIRDILQAKLFPQEMGSFFVDRSNCIEEDSFYIRGFGRVVHVKRKTLENLVKNKEKTVRRVYRKDVRPGEKFSYNPDMSNYYTALYASGRKWKTQYPCFDEDHALSTTGIHEKVYVKRNCLTLADIKPETECVTPDNVTRLRRLRDAGDYVYVLVRDSLPRVEKWHRYRSIKVVEEE